MADLEEELFDCVYQWGRVGLVVDHMAPTFQKMINDIKTEAAKSKGLDNIYAFTPQDGYELVVQRLHQEGELSDDLTVAIIDAYRRRISPTN